MPLAARLSAFSIRPGVSEAIERAVQRPRGLVAFCGPAASGKTTLAEVVIDGCQGSVPRFVGDVRFPEDVRDALVLAKSSLVVATVRSGESANLLGRWFDMGTHEDEVRDADIVIITQRLIRRPEWLVGVLVVEVRSGAALATGSIAEEAQALVDSGVITREEARYFVPGFSQR